MKEFRTDDICEITDVREKTTRQTSQRYESMIGGETKSPYIRKNRGKGMKAVSFFTGKEFLNIDLDS